MAKHSLIVPRDKILLKEVRGSVDYSPLSPDERRIMETVFPKPLMKHRNGTLTGSPSGGRSALTDIGNDKSTVTIKFKGCGLGNHRVQSRKEHSSGLPMGGQTLTYARNEITSQSLVNKFLAEEGVVNGLRPAGVMTYDGYEFEGEQCGAGVFLASGDTRLNELSAVLSVLGSETKHKRAFRKYTRHLWKEIGRYCGSLVHVLYKNDLFWGTTVYKDGDIYSNAHFGNFVLMEDREGDRKLRVGIVDFDASSLSEIIRKKKRLSSGILGHDVESLEKELNKAEKAVWSRDLGYVKKHQQESELVILLGSITENVRYYDLEDREPVTPIYWAGSLTQGFYKGFEKPNFKPIEFFSERRNVQASEIPDFKYYDSKR